MRLSAAGAIGALTFSNDAWKTDHNPLSGPSLVDPKSFGLGLQLYTIRDAMKKDVPGSLKKVSDIGYKYVELADYSNHKFYDYEPSELKKLVNDLGMEILSSHSSVDARGIKPDDVKKMVEDHVELGVTYCMQPWIVEEARKTIGSFQKMTADWNMVGKMMKENGIQFGYHNHNFEFGKVEGKVPYFDIMMVELDKDLVTMELDLFWTTKAGINPVDLFRKYPGRFQLFHMKDMFTRQAPFFTTSGVTDFAPVGAGLIDFKEILAAKDVAGMKYMIVEQDSSKDGDQFAAIRTSMMNLTTKILV